MGDRLAQEGYRGFLEVDVLIDLDTDEVYLGEINPRISGASSMTNVTAGAYADVPLFLFHLLEFMDVDYTVNVEEINDRWRELAAVDVWSQLIMKETDGGFGRAASGRTPDRHLAPRATTASSSFARVSNDWHDITGEDEAFFLRVYGPGDFRFSGADLGILVTKGRMQTAEGLTQRCRRYIDGIRGHYRSEPLPNPRRHPAGLRQVAGDAAGRRCGGATSPAASSPSLRRQPLRLTADFQGGDAESGFTREVWVGVFGAGGVSS